MISTRARSILTAALAALAIMACSPRDASAQGAPRPSAPAPNGPAARSGEAAPAAPGTDSAEGEERIAVLMGKLGITPLRPIAPPDFKLPTLLGGDIGHKDFKGKALLLNFWATWCPPCRAEMPSMEKLRNTLREEGTAFDILAVSVREERKTVKDFLDATPYSFPIVLDSNGVVSNSFVNGGIPTSYVMDKAGLARGFVVGSIDWSAPEAFELFRLLSR